MDEKGYRVKGSGTDASFRALGKTATRGRKERKELVCGSATPNGPAAPPLITRRETFAMTGFLSRKKEGDSVQIDLRIPVSKTEIKHLKG